MPVLVWDTSLGEKHDLSRPCNRSLVLSWMRAGRIRGWHAGVPCNTLTRCRDHGVGAPPVRSDINLLGFPGL
eukprot:7892484-Pyramimonas_sp.AAC.1